MAFSPERQALIDAVEARMDEVSTSATDGVAAHTLIDKHLEAAAYFIARTCARERAHAFAEDASAFAATHAYPLGTSATVLPVPKGYLRLLEVAVDGFGRTIHAAVSKDSPRYRQADNPASAPSTGQPVAFTTTCASGPVAAEPPADRTAIEVRPQIDDVAADLDLLSVVTQESATPERVPDTLQEALLWRAAGLTLQSIREFDPAALALKTADEILAADIGGITA